MTLRKFDMTLRKFDMTLRNFDGLDIYLSPCYAITSRDQ